MELPSSDRSRTFHSGTGGLKYPSGSTIPDALSVEENGRLYSAYRDGKYLLPNDADEQNRLDLQHRGWVYGLGGKLCLAPVKETANVLDIGTGTGIWAIDFARKHPHTNVVGTDLSLIQPTQNVPLNCTFEREDAEDTWVFDKVFDFVHWRLMFSCFNDPKAMIAKIYDNLAPGGWVELQDWSCECVGEHAAAEERYQRSPFRQWVRYLVAGGAAIGRDFQAPQNFKQWMIELGFVDVVEKVQFCPINGWPLDPADKKLGNWCCLDLLEVVGAVTKVLHQGGLSPEGTPAFIEDVRENLKDNDMRVYTTNVIVYGRKPET